MGRLLAFTAGIRRSYGGEPASVRDTYVDEDIAIHKTLELVVKAAQGAN